MKTPRPIEQARSSVLRGSAPALARAAHRAQQLALQTHTALVVVENGKLELLRAIETTETPKFNF